MIKAAIPIARIGIASLTYNVDMILIRGRNIKNAAFSMSSDLNVLGNVERKRFFAQPIPHKIEVNSVIVAIVK